MSALSSLNMLGFDDLTWPITFRYVISGSRGWTTWEISVDAPALQGKFQESLLLGPALFSATIATAICRGLRLDYFDYIIWGESPIPGIQGGGAAVGRRFETPAPRGVSGVLGFNTEHGDKFGRRRHYVLGMPYSWQDENGLTERGWDGLMGYAHLLTMGLSGHLGAGMMQHLHAYFGVIPATVGNIWGVGFRRVTSYNVFQHTDKAPDISEELWPPTHS